MTRSPLWREFESGSSFPLKALRFCILLGGLLFLGFSGVIALSWPQQAVLGLLTVLLAIWMDKSSSSYLITLTLMLVSMFSTFRYAYWRISFTVKFFLDPMNSGWTYLDAFFIWLLVGAEAYAFIILYLGYLQTIWPLRRTPVPLPEDPDNWPAVDLLIPTYNEPLNVVRFTALAAMNIDWPAEKLNVYIIDDGKREEFRKFAEDAGIGYMTRDDNKHAKAGNINAALKRLDAPLVAIFDCDHVPTRSFLQVTVGWFLRDKKLAMLQTPHHFYSPDPFERNLGQFRVIPNEGELFYGIVQDGNDFWNATFFCGSCAVIRRTALEEIGGIAVETVTEDAHTSLRMQINGWNTAYINIPQAAGLATERLSGHVKQRIRWARGMIQILRTDNPLFARGLAPAQRLCYFNAMTHFLYALPRLIFLTAPLIYLILGHVNVPGYWAAILAYAFPHLVLSALTNSRIQGQHRHSFWNEIYETVLAPYIFLPTMLALINPKLGSFNVTAKGGVVNRSFFDTRIAQPFLVMLILNFLGILMAIPRYFMIPYLGWMWDGNHPGTIVMNLIWVLFNIMILGVATAVAFESQQRRQTVRVSMAVPADIVLADGTVVQGVTSDLSSGGCMIDISRSFTALPGEPCKLIFPVLDGDATLPATVVSATAGTLRTQFDPLTLQEDEALTMVLYSRADTWLGWGEAREIDQPMVSLGRILALARHGLAQTAASIFKPKRKPVKGRLATSIAPLILLALFLGGGVKARAAQVANLGAGSGSSTPTSTISNAPTIADATVQRRNIPPGTFDNIFALTDVNVPEAIVLRGVDAYRSVFFSIPETQVPKVARFTLRYKFSQGLLPDISHLKISLNGTLFATLAVSTQPTIKVADNDTNKGDQTAIIIRNETQATLETTLEMPAELLVHNNELTFEFIGHYTLQCEDPANSTIWAEVSDTSQVELQGNLLPLKNDLNLLPLPFYDAAVNLHPVFPIVFLAQPSFKAIRAAGIVSSYFAMLPLDFRPVRFPTSIGTIPAGNAILICENPTDLPASLNITSASGPTIAIRTNPVDPYSKVLILTGDNPDDLVIAAQALAMQRGMLQGDQMRVTFHAPKVREPDDAPRWLTTDKPGNNLGDIAQTGDLQGEGDSAVGAYFRLPPDLYYGQRSDLSYHMNYRYNGIPLAQESSLQVFINGGYVSSTPMPHTDKASANLSTVIAIPVVDMRPFSNSLMMHFIFQIAKKGKCQDTAPLNLQGAIIKDSYIDIKDIPHWAILPDLELFANAGYPFTRRADLADTTVILPDQPTPEELEIFLTFMGHFGAQTGYPVINVTVANSQAMKADASKDYFLLGAVDDQPALSQIDSSLPVSLDRDGLHVQDTQGFFGSLQHGWWKVKSSDHVNSGQLQTAGGMPDTIIEGIEWPARSNRTVVIMAIRDKSVVPNMLSVFLKNSQSSDISQSVSVLHGAHFISYRIGNDVYRVGSLSWLVQVNMICSEFPWIVVAATLVLCLLMAALVRAMLRRKARQRLQSND